ncbi:MAG: hypothetical protein ACWGQW_17875 [bacterium]
MDRKVSCYLARCLGRLFRLRRELKRDEKQRDIERGYRIRNMGEILIVYPVYSEWDYTYWN